MWIMQGQLWIVRQWLDLGTVNGNLVLLGWGKVLDVGVWFGDGTLGLGI